MSTNIRRNSDSSSSDNLETGRKTLVNGGKSSSLKEKEIVAGTGWLETSLHNVLRLLNEIFI